MNFDVLRDVLIEPFSVTTQWVTRLLLKEYIGIVVEFCPIELPL